MGNLLCWLFGHTWIYRGNRIATGWPWQDCVRCGAEKCESWPR